MFNTEIKQRFIDWKMSRAFLSPFFLKNLFKKSQAFEEEHNKDVSNFTVKEIVDMYKTISYNTTGVILNANSAFVGYTDWCMEQGFVPDHQNHFREIDQQVLMSLTNKAIQRMRIVDREQIVSWCDQLDSPSEAFVLLGLFEGINGNRLSDFYQLLVTDIDVDKRTIKIPGRGEMKFSTKLCELGIESADTYDRPRSNRQRKVPIDPLRVIKDYKNVTDTDDPLIKRRRIYNKLCMALKKLGIFEYMNAQAIVDSGIVEYIKTESRRLNMDTIIYARTHVDDINFRFCKNFVAPHVLLKRVGDFI